jgi:hypothetical protein
MDEPGAFSGLPLHRLRPASRAQAKALAASPSGVLDLAEREPALPAVEIQGAEVMLPNLIENRSERNWTSPNSSGKLLRGTLVGTGTESGQPVLFVLGAESRIFTLPIAGLEEGDRAYLEEIQSGSLP